MKYSILLLCVLMLGSAGLAQTEAVGERPEKPETPAASEKLVSFSVSDEKVSKATDEICKQAGVRILLEKTAEVKITGNVEQVSVEDALAVICKAGELEWRRIYIKADSPMLKNPEMLASTLRLMEGLKFPDMIIEKTSTKESLVHVGNKPTVDAVPISLRKDMGMVALYLITNDKAAKKAKEKADSSVEKYMALQKESMELFLKMTPEEREQAMVTGMGMVQQMDPNYMTAATHALMKNPGMMEQIMQTQMQGMFQMPAEDRRAIMRMQIQAMQFITPEMRQLMQEDAIAVMKEMGIEPGAMPQ